MNARLQDVRLVELGMAVERQLSTLHRQTSGGSNIAPPSPASNAPDDLAAKLEGVQAAIEDVQFAIASRESVSPRSNSPRTVPTMVGTIETRIRANASIDEDI